MQFCVFRVYAPLSSWGDIAVGLERRSFYQPSKSAIVGLVSAAIGIDRYKNDKLRNLFDSLGVGIKLINPGDSIIDYHTTQTIKKNRKVVYRTRRDELHANPDKVNTILSSREYRCDSLSIVALWINESSEKVYSLEEIRQALLSPKYHLYLGRKSCPPALPLQPQIVQGNTLKEVLNNTKFGPIIFPFSEIVRDIKTAKFVEKQIFRKNKAMFFWESCGNSGFSTWTRRSEKYDRPINRERWQFGLRYEYSTMED
jgi:CRISPR system Cascade subunit CasD